MGLRDLLKEKAEKHGGLRGLAKQALRRAGGGGAEPTSPPTSPPVEAAASPVSPRPRLRP
ncbi:MAG: hypothetical protein IPO67_11060 [Deltaproteobacteria bacterium]|nr:hypothetical protein [Deltaproteobacteria bacterium]